MKTPDPTPAEVLEALARVMSHEELQAEIARRYRERPRTRIAIAADIWRDRFGTEAV